jgi:hypothetical protein
MIEFNSKLLEQDNEYMITIGSSNFARSKYIGYTNNNKYLFEIIGENPGYYNRKTKSGKIYHLSYIEQEVRKLIACKYEKDINGIFEHWGK